MMGADKPVTRGHPTTDELELLIGEPATRSRRAVDAHVARCDECRRQVAALRSLEGMFRSMPRFAPAARFAERVMARVRLPRPWYVAVWATMRAHWVATSAATAAAVGAVIGTTGWLFSHPEVTPRGLIGFLLNESQRLVWRGVVSVGRWVFDSGLPSVLSGLVEQVQLTQAVVAMGALSLLSIGAIYTLLRLIRTPVTAHVAGRRG